MKSESFHPAGTPSEKGPEPVMPGVNPDRVKFDDSQKVETVIEPARTEQEVYNHRFVEHGGELRVEKVGGMRAGAFVRRMLPAFALLGVATNAGVEYSRGETADTARTERVMNALDTVDVETIARQAQDEVCNVVDAQFMQRFTTLDENGKEVVNPGAVVIPFAVAVNSECKTKVDVQVRVPYHFARTFREISAAHPERRAEMAEKLAGFIKQEIKNQLVVHGIAGVTGSKLVYDRENGSVTREADIDLGKFEVSDISATGFASAEAEASSSDAGPASLTHPNEENAQLAGKRLNDMMPLLKDAFTRSGVNAETISSIREISYERNLVDGEVASLAAISHDVLGETVTNDDEHSAYELVQEINDGNPIVLEAISANPEYAETVKKLITDNRGVVLSLTAETDQKKTEVYNLPIPWPLFLLLLPGIRVSRGARTSEWKPQYRNVHTDAIIRNDPKAVARRLFSESTPETLAEKRDFNEIYDSVGLSERPMDTRLLLEHLLLEEVKPSLDEATKEPMIDYEEAVNSVREYLMSDARRGEVSKGSYDTAPEAERKLTETLLSMWERHDEATYPMQGIDIKTVLNYRHTPYVVYWAKTLADRLVPLAEETTTREQFRERLQEVIATSEATRDLEGGTDRNVFVRSDLPLQGRS
ncbi:MAG: hypothetical protein JWL75_111 [Parcubacteria group bacterium]|nr:hypothetical protein [Parcubacteria group bacterium]